MRIRAIIIATLAGLLLLPAVAFAQEDAEDPCYVNPLAPECLEEEPPEVGGVVVERPPTPTSTPDVAVLGTVQQRPLAVTGTEAATLAILAAGLLGGGFLLLRSSRRRTQRDRASTGG